MPSLVVLITTSSEEDASRIADALVGERLAACVNIVPAVRSVYRWQDRIERAQECLLIVKSTDEALTALTARVKALHSYTVPEILAVPVSGGSGDYLDWLTAQVRVGSAARPAE
jgi:periplasmic divalent cation tolerance protein